ncbi:MAG TPA: hypothetical protein VEH04_08555 [Verrucomicrobiae bacterium]|nr:hypothetical protein [Verrucomicrobiae bacterium]
MKHSYRHVALAAVLLIGFASTAAAATNEGWDERFGRPGVSPVTLISMQNALYAGGRFASAGEVAVNGVARWDGTRWSPVGSGVTNDTGPTFVNSLATDGENLYAAGSFNRAGDSLANNVARWNGAKWSSLGSGVQGTIHTIAVDGGYVYVGGSFFIPSINASNIAVWTGTEWLPLATNLTLTFGVPIVRAIVVDTDGVYIGGNFTSIDGVTATNVAKWNGAGWAPVGTGIGTPGHQVISLAVWNGSLYAGGSLPNGNVARWDGSTWSALGTGADGTVLTLFPNGNELCVGGFFDSAGGVNAGRIARWNGTEWSAFEPGIDPSSTGAAYAFASWNGGLFVGGTFARVGGGLTVNGIARHDANGWTALGGALNNFSDVRAVTAAGSNVYVGGLFFQTGQVLATNISRWDGRRWWPLGTGVNGIVYAIAVDGSNVYAGGTFTRAGNVTVTNLARWNGAAWSSVGAGVNNTVNALAARDGVLYAAGLFTSAGGAPANRVARWDGTNWFSLGAGFTTTVNALCLAGTNLYAGGSFAAGNPGNRIARWDGSAWFPLGSGLNNAVSAIVAMGDSIYAGGSFQQAGGSGANRVAKWDGTSWSPLGAGLNNSVLGLSSSLGNLYAAGTFFQAGGSNATRVARWDGVEWHPLGSGANNIVSAIAAVGTNVHVGGTFLSAGGKPSLYFGIWHPPVPEAFISAQSGGIIVTWTSEPNQTYQLLSTTNLGAGFSPLGEKVTASADRTAATNIPVSELQFFRVEQVAP